MLPKNTRKSIDHQKWAHGKTVKNHPKSNIITLKAPKKKALQNPFFLNIPKWLFYFWITYYNLRLSKIESSR
jgi:hypothetical protein